MKNACFLSTFLTCLIAVPVFADDDHVPESTLRSLGLAGMEILSEAEGMQVRGSGSDVLAMSNSYVSGLLISPDTKSFLFGSDSNGSMANAEHAGNHSVPRAYTNTLSGFAFQLDVAYPGLDFSAFFIGGAGGNAISAGY